MSPRRPSMNAVEMVQMSSCRPVYLRIRAQCFFLVTVLACCAASLLAQDGIRYYRVQSVSWAGDEQFLVPVSPNGRGEYFGAEVDANNRTVRVRRYQDGNEIAYEVFHYQGSQSLPDAIESFGVDEFLSEQKFTRDRDGLIVRIDVTNRFRAPLAVVTFDRRGDSVSAITRSPDGKTIEHKTVFFSQRRLLRAYSVHDPANPRNYVYVEVDEKSGLQRGAREVRAGVAVNTRSFWYNKDGDLLRSEGFDATGASFVVDEYSGGLLRKRSYSDAREYRLIYDEKRRNASTEVVYSGALVCRLVYELKPDKTILRTVAQGPSGDTWAVYEGNAILEIKPDGRPVNSEPAIVYKRGRWW